MQSFVKDQDNRSRRSATSESCTMAIYAHASDLKSAMIRSLHLWWVSKCTADILPECQPFGEERARRLFLSADLANRQTILRAAVRRGGGIGAFR